MHVVIAQQQTPSTYVRRRREDWITIIQAWLDSSLTQREFCSQHGVALSSFYKWRQKLSAESVNPTPSQADEFVSVFIERLWRSPKYEEVYLNAYDTIDQAKQSLQRYFDFYNSRRRHQSLKNQAPDSVCFQHATKMAA